MKKQIRLNLGCGANYADGYINVDAFMTPADVGAFLSKGAEFVKADVRNLPFKKNFADYIESVDMIEHIPMRNVLRVFQEIYRVLKPRGLMRIATTDFDGVARDWLEASRELEEAIRNKKDPTKVFDPRQQIDDRSSWNELVKPSVNKMMMIIYGNQTHQGEYHQNLFTESMMRMYLLAAGFKNKNIKIHRFTKGSLPPQMPAFPVPEEIVASTVLISDELIAEARK